MRLDPHGMMSVELPLVDDNAHDALVSKLDALLFVLSHLQKTCLSEDYIGLNLELLQVV